MKQSVVYLNEESKASLIAKEIADILPEKNISLLEVKKELDKGMKWDTILNKDVYYICFDYNRGLIPVEIIELLIGLEGKKVSFYVTTGFEPTDKMKDYVAKEIKKYLSDDCIWCGLFLCAGEFPEDILQKAEEALKDQESKAKGMAVLENYEKTKGHPDDEDFLKLWKFLLKLR